MQTKENSQVYHLEKNLQQDQKKSFSNLVENIIYQVRQRINILGSFDEKKVVEVGVEDPVVEITKTINR